MSESAANQIREHYKLYTYLANTLRDPALIRGCEIQACNAYAILKRYGYA